LFTNRNETQDIDTNCTVDSISPDSANMLCFSIEIFPRQRKSDLDPAAYTEQDEFVTNSGIRIGLPLDNLIKIKGNSYKIDFTYPEKYISDPTGRSLGYFEQLGPDTVITYEFNDVKNSSFLQRYNKESYYMKYQIKDNKVESMRFGFYPNSD